MTDIGRRMQITPETKVGSLLESYPQLESVLLEMSPAFSKLKNPLLRKTVAKIATLRQIAAVGNLPLGRLINELRQAAGMQSIEDLESTERQSQTPPPWFRPEKESKRLDARDMIDRGEHPVGKVQKDLRDLEHDDIYELVTPFVPAPIIELAEKQGFRTWTTNASDDLVKTYFSLGRTDG